MVQESFALVRLHPIDPKLILDNCQKQSPVTAESDEDGIIEELARKISIYSGMQMNKIDRLRSSVKHVDTLTTKKAKNKDDTRRRLFPEPRY